MVIGANTPLAEGVGADEASEVAGPIALAEPGTAIAAGRGAAAT